MSRLGITFEEVAQAAEAILHQGESPTIDKVRQSLGGTGSNTTISKYLNDWRNHYFHRHTETSLKNHTPDPVKSAVERVWQEMSAQANAEIQAMKEALTANAIEAEAKIKLVTEERDAINHEFEGLRDNYRDLAAQKEILSLDLKAIQDERVLSCERYKNLEERYAELHHQTSQHLKDLSETHLNEIHRLENQATKTDVARRELIDAMKSQYEADRLQYMRSLDELRTEVCKKEESVSNLQTLLNDQQIATAELRVTVDNLVRERDQLISQYAKQEIDRTTVYEQYKKIDGRLVDLQLQSKDNHDHYMSWINCLTTHDSNIMEAVIKVNDVAERLNTSAERTADKLILEEAHGA